ncbi:hypothetical protein [Peribacillus simplex]|uniref:hypothetical protein n=1 Tax=Peribacillus simplex TaxID=1478 RepID=UPI0024C1C47B|nr:hypothetical protein [Peribacillus simplex]WHY54275.1 hypothetical protein QNH43_13810 [Peribacillus simplex]
MIAISEATPWQRLYAISDYCCFENWSNYCRYPSLDAANTIIFLDIPRIIRNTTFLGKSAKIEKYPC